MFINKKNLCVVLILLLFILTACDNSAPAQNPAETNKPVEKQPEAPTEDIVLFPEGEYDFGGYNFRALINGPAHNWYESTEIYSESDTGVPINDAVYKRNIIIEDKYNFRISVVNDTGWGEVPARARKSIMAGDDDYDIVMPMINDASPLAHDSLLIDLKTVPGLNLPAPWWDRRANEQLAIYDKLFFTTGDISILDKYCTFVTFFNKTLIADFGLENPYSLVRDGNWTQDKVTEMIKGVSADLNGDGVMDYDDRWGLLTDTSIAMALFYGSGEHITKQTPDGGLEITILNERSQSVLNKAFGFIYDKTSVIFAENLKTSHPTVWDAASTLFAENRALFRMAALISVSEEITISSDINFGILPQPKYNKEQPEYNNFVSTLGVPGVCIPVTCGNLERTGVIIDAFARYATDTVRHTFYDIVLTNRLVRDEESREMLDLIFETKTYDLGVIYNFGTLKDMFYSMAAAGNVNFASECEKRMDKANKELAEILAKYSLID